MALFKLLSKLFSVKRPYHASFPDHIWMRHSALLVAAQHKTRRNGRV